MDDGARLLSAVPTFALAVVVSLLAACGSVTYRDVSHEEPYQSMVGRKYQIIGEIRAYGIATNLNAKRVDYITLIPLGIAGPEVVTTNKVAPGSTVTVLSVQKTNRWIDGDLTYFVELLGTKLPPTPRVQIDLMRGNEAKASLELNPVIFRPIQ